jgi:uncharacterized protein YdeI (YjbR/CyaY-like superfamily)
VQQVDVEQQDVAGLAFHNLCQRLRQRVLWPAAMRARDDLRSTVRGAERVEERQRGNHFGGDSVAVQILRAAALARFSPLDLRQEERLLQDVMHGGQHDRQAANLLYGGIEIDQGMTPIGATGNRPLFRRQHAGLEGIAKRCDPGRGNGAAQQEITLLVKTPRVFGVEPTHPGGRQESRHGYLADHRQNGRTAAFLGYSPHPIQGISTADDAEFCAGTGCAAILGHHIERLSDNIQNQQMAPVKIDPAKVREFRDAGSFYKWLGKHHAGEDEIWIKIHKVDSGLQSITPKQAIDVVLCWGWIDAIRKGFDDTSYLQRYTPRGRKSIWSRINIDNVARLIDEGRMTEHGLKLVEAAKADGRWDRAYPSGENMQIPRDLQAAIDAEPKAKAMLATLSAQNRFALAFRTHNMKTEAGRSKKITAFVDMLKRGETIHPQGKKPRKK